MVFPSQTPILEKAYFEKKTFEKACFEMTVPATVQAASSDSRKVPKEWRFLRLKLAQFKIESRSLPYNSEDKPGAYIFQRHFLTRGLYSEGLNYGGRFAFQNRLA